MFSEYIREKYEEGYSIDEITLVVPYCKSTVWKKLKAMGVEIRRRGPKGKVMSREMAKKAKDMLRNGNSCAQVSRAVGVSPQAISAMKRRMTRR